MHVFDLWFDFCWQVFLFRPIGREISKQPANHLWKLILVTKLSSVHTHRISLPQLRRLGHAYLLVADSVAVGLTMLSAIWTAVFVCGVKVWPRFLYRIYVCGGRDGSSCLRSLEYFDPHTNKWTLLAQMNKRRGQWDSPFYPHSLIIW